MTVQVLLTGALGEKPLAHCTAETWLVWASIPTRKTEPQTRPRAIVTPTTGWVISAFYASWIETTSRFACSNNAEHIYKQGNGELPTKFIICEFKYLTHHSCMDKKIYCGKMAEHEGNKEEDLQLQLMV